MNKRTYNFLLEHAAKQDSVFSRVFFSENPEIELERLLEDGYLEPVPHSGNFYATISGCRRLVHETIVHGKPYYYYIDEDETVEVSPEDAKHYRLDFTPLARLIRRELKAQKGFTEMIPGKLWLCGQAGRQLRELYLARNAGQDANIGKVLNGDTVPQRAIIFQLGHPDNGLSEKFTEQKVWNLHELLNIESSVLHLNKEPIEARIDYMCENKETPVHRTGKAFLNAKKRVEAFLCEMFGVCLDNVRSAANDGPITPLPHKRIRHKKRKTEDFYMFHDQATLAALLKITPKMMTLIKQEWEKFEKIDDACAAYLALLSFFAKQKFDSESVFAFHDNNKTALRAIGLYEDY